MTSVHFRADAYLADPFAVLTSKQIHCEISLSNPLGEAISLTSIDVSISFMEKSLGRVAHDFSKDPIVIPRKQTVRTRAVCVHLDSLANLALIKAFFKAASTSHGAPMHFVGPIGATIGGDGGSNRGYTVTLTLDQGPVCAPFFMLTQSHALSGSTSTMQSHALCGSTSTTTESKGLINLEYVAALKPDESCMSVHCLSFLQTGFTAFKSYSN